MIVNQYADMASLDKKQQQTITSDCVLLPLLKLCIKNKKATFIL